MLKLSFAYDYKLTKSIFKFFYLILFLLDIYLSIYDSLILFLFILSLRKNQNIKSVILSITTTQINNIYGNKPNNPQYYCVKSLFILYVHVGYSGIFLPKPILHINVYTNIINPITAIIM